MMKPLLGASPRRIDVVLGVVAGVAAAAGAFAVTPSPWLAAITADVGAGIVANASTSTSQWYAKRPAWLHVLFIGAHAAHVGVAAWAGGGTWAWASALFAVMAAGVLVVRLAPASAATPLALAVLVAGSALLPSLPGFPPFAALFLVKLVFGFGLHARRV